MNKRVLKIVIILISVVVLGSTTTIILVNKNNNKKEPKKDDVIEVIKEPSKDNDPEPIEVVEEEKIELTEEEKEEQTTTSKPSTVSKPVELIYLAKDFKVNPNSIYMSSSYNKVDATDTYFSDSVFVGDSVSLGFNYFVTGYGSSFMGGPKFLTVGSLSVWNLLGNVTSISLHPYYKGAKRLVEDSIKLMNAKKVFICLGLNDIGITGINGTINNYAKLISRIKEKNPDTKIYIISTTYIAQGGEKQVLNNPNLRVLNYYLRTNAPTWNASYINIADYLIDSNGYIKSNFSSDRYVHFNNTAYAVWLNVLRQYASNEILEKTINDAAKLVEIAETSNLKADYDNALNSVNKITNESIRTELLNRLKVVLDKIELLKKSDDATLSSLSVDNYNIDFNKDTLSYNVNVESDITSIKINATVNEIHATLTGTGFVNINYGINKVIIKVTSERGNIKEYIINVNRYDNRSSINTLDSISINNDIIDLSNLEYNTSQESIEISVIKNDINSVVSGSGIHNLEIGTNTINITVTAENGNTKIYTIIVNRGEI